MLRVYRQPAAAIACWMLASAPLWGDWQQAVDRALRGIAGSAVVLDAASGKTLAANGPEASLPPGSTAKPFTLLALIESGKVNSRTAIVCKRKLTLRGRRMDCTHPVPPGPVDAVTALAYSCNWFFATLAPGAWVPPRGELAIPATPLELARSYRRLALRREEPALAPLFAGLEAATEWGTARLAQPEGVRVAGKTGTASQHGRRYGWFAGYAPAGAPRIVVVVLVSQGSGGGDAAPIAREIFKNGGTGLLAGRRQPPE